MAGFPDFTALTLVETAYKYLLRQAFFRKIKDNLDNLNGRASQLESGIALLDHFTFVDQRFQRHPPIDLTTTSDDIIDMAGKFYGFREFAGGSGTLPPLWTFPSNSVLRIATGQGSNANAKNHLMTLSEYVFNNVTRPLIYECRTQWRGSAGTPAQLWGMFGTVPGIMSGPLHGIYLGFPDSTNMRFTSIDNGSATNGTSFTRVAANTWFTIKIEFTDTPSNRALCYIDGVLKETLTTNLPTSRRLHGAVYVTEQNDTATVETDVDKIKYAPVALADAA